jgi:hypothetical protein
VLEPRGVGHVAVGDAMDVGAADASARVDERVEDQFRASPRLDPDDGHLDDAIDPGPHAGRLEIEDGHRYVGNGMIQESVRRAGQRAAPGVGSVDSIRPPTTPVQVGPNPD